MQWKSFQFLDIFLLDIFSILNKYLGKELYK